jgi:hypothetical protein
MRHVPPGQPGSMVRVEPRYENFIGGRWLAPTQGRYRVGPSPEAGNERMVQIINLNGPSDRLSDRSRVG